jgi:hypothetical protein
LGERVSHIAGLVETVCPQQEWLFFASFLGLFVIARWLIWDRDRDRNRLLVPLCIYHGGVLGFSLLDFQFYGDFFVLLHSIAFLWGLTWLALFEAGTALLGTRFPGSSMALRSFGALILMVAVAVARPTFLRPDLELPNPTINAGGTLADQREVAAELLRQTRGQKFVLTDSSELLFLMRHKNPLPNIYMNRATRSYLRTYANESDAEITTRLLRSVDPDVFVESHSLARRPTPFVKSYAQKRISSKNGKYRVTLRVRSTLPPHR